MVYGTNQDAIPDATIASVKKLMPSGERLSMLSEMARLGNKILHQSTKIKISPGALGSVMPVADPALQNKIFAANVGNPIQATKDIHEWSDALGVLINGYQKFFDDVLCDLTKDTPVSVC
jgi:hypothetical protein